jgi:PadR family transcriptional regulator PadR
MMGDCECDMRGMLSFLILWLLNLRPMSGAELARELERRKGVKPTPGTIYPALKGLARKKAIVLKASGGRAKVYALTPAGRRVLESARNAFCKAFYDVLSR